MYNLQEAYLGVYYDLDEGVLGEAMAAGPRQKRMRQIEFRPGTTGRDRAHAFNIAVRGDTKPFDSPVKSKTPQGKGNKNKRRRGLPVRDTRPGKEDYSNSLTETPQNEGYDLYDLIFDYLLDEGYADTEEAATVIMANMSEDWIDDIYEEVLDERRNVTDRPLGILHRFARGVRTKKGEKTERLGTDREGNPTQKYYVMQRQKREAQRERDADEARRRDNDAMGRGTWDKD